MSELDWRTVERHLRAVAEAVGKERQFDGVMHRPQDMTAGRILFALADAINGALESEREGGG